MKRASTCRSKRNQVRGEICRSSYTTTTGTQNNPYTNKFSHDRPATKQFKRFIFDKWLKLSYFRITIILFIECTGGDI